MKKSIDETIFDEANSWIKLNQKVVGLDNFSTGNKGNLDEVQS